MTSSAETGSSQIRISGDAASARAIATRCRWPPESVSGRRRATDASSPTCSSRAATRRSEAGGVLRRGCDADGVGEDASDAPARIEGAERVLVDRADAATLRPPCAFVEPRPRRPVERHLAGVGRRESEREASDRRLARPRLADEPEGLAAVNLERDVVDGGEAPAGHDEALAHVVEREQRGYPCVAPSRAGVTASGASARSAPAARGG